MVIQRSVHLDPQCLSVKIIQNIQGSKRSSAGQIVAHEVD